jgi:two-component system, OmpR family, sensor histidine kinase KdpD
VTSLGGSFRQVPGQDVAGALLEFARAENATQMVLGASRRSRLATLIAGKSTPTRLARRAGHIDVHLVSREDAGHAGQHPARPLAGSRSRRDRAERANAEAAALTRLANSVLRGHSDPPALLEELREMFGLAAVSLLERRPDAQNGWFVTASAGESAPEGPGADIELMISENFTLAARGTTLDTENMQVLCACATQLMAGIIHRREGERFAAERAVGPGSRTALIAATIQRPVS